MIRCEVEALNVFVIGLTCPTRQLIPNAIWNGRAVGVGGHARIEWHVHLLYNQSARDGSGVYPFPVSVQHLERLDILLPKDGETLWARLFSCLERPCRLSAVPHS